MGQRAASYARVSTADQSCERQITAAPDFSFDPELIARVSPIEWKNVILYGEIKIDPNKLKIRGR